MRTNWKVIQRDPKQGKWAMMYVTLSPKGTISLTNYTWEQTGRPEAYLILFDEENQRIGLKPTATGIKHAYPVLKRGPALGKKIHAYKMLADQRIKLKLGVRFTDIEIDHEGILILDLRTAETSSLSSARRRRLESQKQTTAVSAE